MSEITDEILETLEKMSNLGESPPWRAMIEGRDHRSGDSFIQIGLDDDRTEDMYVSRDSGPAISVDLDLIVAARNYLPILIEEIRRLKVIENQRGQ